MFDTKKYSQLKKEEERLKEEKQNIMDECSKKGISYKEYQEKVFDVVEELYFIDKEIRKIQEPIMTYGKEWQGSTIVFEKFIELVSSGELMDDDGIGYYATDSAKSDISIIPSDVIENIYRTDFTHIIWFNK